MLTSLASHLGQIAAGVELLGEATMAGVLLLALDKLAASVRMTYRAGRLAGTAWFRWGLPALLATADFASWCWAQVEWQEAFDTLLAFIALVITAWQFAIEALAAVRDRWVAWHDVAPTTTAAPLPPAVSLEGAAAEALSQQRVTELRKAARAAGMSHLGRRGRKAELIAALAAA